MPVQLQIIPEIPLTYDRYSGTVTLLEIIKQMKDTYLRPDYIEGACELADLTDTDNLVLNKQEFSVLLEEVAWHHSGVGPNRKMCVVRPPNKWPATEDLFLRLKDKTGDVLPIHIVDTPADAVALLGISSEHLHLLPSKFSGHPATSH
ncbi:MAG: hypothetical protein GY883_09280 [Shimia sp.]|nr:hypothetical protein [Shimia sp.]